MAEVTLTALTNKIRDEVAGSTAIKSYCTTNFGGAHTVYVGATGDESPDEADYPVVNIQPLSKQRPDEDDDRSFDFQVDFIGENSTKTTTAATENTAKKVEYAGPCKVEGVLDLIWDEIESISNELIFNEKSFEIDSIENFPAFSGRLHLTITYPACQGTYEPSLS